MAPPGTEVRGFRVEILRRKRGSVLAQHGAAGGVLGKVGNRSESRSRGPQRAPFLRLLGWLRDDTVLTHPLKPRSTYDNLHAGLKADSTRTASCSEFPQYNAEASRPSSRCDQGHRNKRAHNARVLRS